MDRNLQLVIDTDVGSDDAIALILCIAAEMRGELKIRGITCVHGNTSLYNVYVNTLKLLHALRRLDIPVYRGAAESIVETTEQTSNIHGKDGFGDLEYPNAPEVDKLIQKRHAVSFLSGLVSKFPGEITILALGPLTNIALAIRMNPRFKDNVKDILILGGNMEGIGCAPPLAEFNFCCDPEAAHITLHNLKCPIKIFPREAASWYGRISYEWRKNELGRINSPQARLMNKVERTLLEQKKYGVWARCEPLAAAVLLYPQVAISRIPCYATVELHGAATRGTLFIDHVDKLGKIPITLIERLNVDMYKTLLFQAFTHNFHP